MTQLPPRPSRRPQVLVAAGAVVVLATLLGLRLLAGARLPETSSGRPVAPAATVPAPKSVDLATLEVPNWGSVDAQKWPVAFRTDLDLLAPLGDGPANAGLFFKDFAKPAGRSLAEATAAMERRVDGPPGLDKVLPPDDPLLLEAEPWCDQATMRFYPDFFPLEGYATRLPNLLVPLTLAKSWVARGLASNDPARAMADFRRAIRLGRLLRQEDATIIADLVGLACVRVGAQGVYDVARKTGDAPLALIASVVLGEHAPQRLLTAERISKIDLSPFVRLVDGAPVLSLPEKRFATLVEMAKHEPELRFRGEAMIALARIHTLGSAAQQEKVVATLRELAASNDARVSAFASWNLEHFPTKGQIAEMVSQPPD